jgi:hypothetical protein
MANSWFPLTTNGANTWAPLDDSVAPRTASVSCSSSITVVKRHASPIAVSVSSTATISTGSVGYITGGGPLSINVATVSLLIPVTSSVSVAVQGRRVLRPVVTVVADVESVGGTDYIRRSGNALLAAVATTTIVSEGARGHELSVVSTTGKPWSSKA